MRRREYLHSRSHNRPHLNESVVPRSGGLLFGLPGLVGQLGQQRSYSPQTDTVEP